MNIYVIVEGEIGEKKLYQSWIPLVNPDLIYVNHISLIQNNHFAIISGGGYPHYFDVIRSAIEDVNSYANIDRLVVSVDSEELSYNKKLNEISDFIFQFQLNAKIYIIIQHFCLETWALANKLIISPNTQSRKLIEYKRFYNVRLNDPELLPAYKKEELNRSQFAEKYLRHAVNDKYRNLTYTKKNPKVLLHHKYFNRVKERFQKTGQIKSFSNFLSAFA
jgi:hypothetical protein